MNIQIFFETTNNIGGELAVRINNKPIGLKKTVFQNQQMFFCEIPGYSLRKIQVGIRSIRGNETVKIYIVEIDHADKSFVQLIELEGGQREKFILFDLADFSIRHISNKNLSENNDYYSDQQSGKKITNPKRVRLSFNKQVQSEEAKGKDFSFYENQGQRDQLLTTISEGNNKLVEVFYATDRKQKMKKKGRITYTNSRGSLLLGKCTVSIPANKAKGALPTPPWYVFTANGNEDKYMLIKEVSVLTADTFFEEMKQKVQASSEKDAFLFVHGFNVSFTESVLRTAQIASDIGFQGAPVVYSWPSRKSLLRYKADEATSTGFSTDSIITILKDIRKYTNAERVHIIAHSMGNRLITDALKSLFDQEFNKDFLFNQIILAAPDIDADVFIKHIAPKIMHCSNRVTLYASQADKPLWFSGNIHGNIQRAGFITDKISVIQGIDTVDATKATTDLLGHGYFAESKALIDDIFQITRFNRNPADRNLRKKESGDNIYWEFW